MTYITTAPCNRSIFNPRIHYPSNTHGSINLNTQNPLGSVHIVWTRRRKSTSLMKNSLIVLNYMYSHTKDWNVISFTPSHTEQANVKENVVSFAFTFAQCKRALRVHPIVIYCDVIYITLTTAPSIRFYTYFPTFFPNRSRSRFGLDLNIFDLTMMTLTFSLKQARVYDVRRTK